jgi:hypothetical protein
MARRRDRPSITYTDRRWKYHQRCRQSVTRTVPCSKASLQTSRCMEGARSRSDRDSVHRESNPIEFGRCSPCQDLLHYRHVLEFIPSSFYLHDKVLTSGTVASEQRPGVIVAEDHVGTNTTAREAYLPSSLARLSSSKVST